MNVLVAANKMTLGSTSEGICTSKFLGALARAGHEIRCITSDPEWPADGGDAGPSWLPGVRVTHLNAYRHGRSWARILTARKRAASSVRPVAYIDRKVDPVAAYTTGHSLLTWETAALWRSAVTREIERVRPDVVFSRASGVEFEPHMALLTSDLRVPVIAHYHDPYPHSLYPDPYRSSTPIMSRRQESLHRRMLRAADALTFPSERLRDWIVGDADDLLRKAFVVPHIAGDLGMDDGPRRLVAGEASSMDDFLLVHAGTLLAGRDPGPLLRAFEDLLREKSESRGTARLLFVGRISAQHLDLPEWKRLSGSGRLVSDDRRIGYHDALRISSTGIANVILEADCGESPFFPAKLADSLWLDRPIFTITPRPSATRDILGEDYALLCRPGDEDAIYKALTMLWERWESGRLDELRPPARAKESVSETVAIDQAERAIEHAVARTRSHAAATT